MKTKKIIDLIDQEIEKEYYRIAQGKVVDIFDIPKVFADSRRAIANGSEVNQAVRAAVLMYSAIDQATPTEEIK